MSPAEEYRLALQQEREELNRPAPVVPDSTGLRDRVQQAVDTVAVDHPAWTTAHTNARPFTGDGEANFAQFVDDITDAVLAVVGQGVTAGWATRANEASLRALAGHTWGVVKSRPRNDGVTGRPFGPHEHPREW